MRLLIHNATVADGSGAATYTGWVSAVDDTIEAVGRGEPSQADIDAADEVVDAGGDVLMPGGIDCHVHFREPGLESKATIASESRAALAGGITSFIDMPNTKPTTTTIEAWEDKMKRAAASSVINYAFMLGATVDNQPVLQRADYSRVAAVKVFMGSSTGGMLLSDDNALRAVFADQPARVVVHAEDQSVIDANVARFSPIADPENMMWHTRLRSSEACVRATERAMELAARYGTRLHIAHLTTREEVSLFDPSDSPVGRTITAEVSPHHLLFTADDYARLGSRIKMNPAVKYAADRETLRRGLAEGRIDIVATDHAPHRLADKQGDVFHAASGAPMVQFSLPAVMTIYGGDAAFVAHRMAAAPAALYGIERRGRLADGCYADMVLMHRLAAPHVVGDDDVLSLCGWTPLVGTALDWEVRRTWVNGTTAQPMAMRFVSK